MSLFRFAGIGTGIGVVVVIVLRKIRAGVAAGMSLKRQSLSSGPRPFRRRDVAVDPNRDASANMNRDADASACPATLRDLAWTRLCEPGTLVRVAEDARLSRGLANALLDATLKRERMQTADLIGCGRLGTILRLPLFRDAAVDVLRLDAWPGPIDGPVLFATLQRLKMSWRELSVASTSLSGRPSCRSRLPRLARALDRLDCSDSVFCSPQAVAAWTPLLAACRHLVTGNWLRSSGFKVQDSLLLIELTRALALSDRLEALTCSFPGAVRLLSGLSSKGMDARFVELQVAVHSNDDAGELARLLSRFTRLATLAVAFEGNTSAQTLLMLVSSLSKDALQCLTLSSGFEVDSRELAAALSRLAALKALNLQTSVSDAPDFLEQLVVAEDHLPRLRRLCLVSADGAINADLLHRVGATRPLLRIRLKHESLDLQHGMLVYNVDLET
jgi:hypothetical protein